MSARGGIRWAVALLACIAARPAGLAHAEPPRLVFHTSRIGTGNLSSWGSGGTGLEAGDLICHQSAAAAGLPSPETFVAWLSDSHDDAYCRIHGLHGKKADNCGEATLPSFAGPWMRTDGLPFGATIADLLAPSGVVYTPASLDEYGLPELTWWWTGTGPDGVALESLCQNWTSSGGDSGWSGYGTSTRDMWTKWFLLPCFNKMSLLCMQPGSGPPLPPFAQQGLTAFLSDSVTTGAMSFGGATGRAAGDLICKSDAAAAGLPRANWFRAYLWDSNGDAVTPLSPFDGPWVTVEGIPVAANTTDLDTGLTGSISTTAMGLHRNTEVWANVKTPYTAACGPNWSSTSDLGLTGLSVSTDDWSSYGSAECSSALPLYCFETEEVFTDGFEKSVAAWSSQGTNGSYPARSGFAALVGSFGLRAAILDTGDTRPLYVEDDSPAAEPSYHARFYFHPRNFDPGESQGAHRARIFIALAEEPAAQRLVAIVLRRISGAYSLSARVRLDDGSTRDTAFVPIAATSHWLELEWNRATSPGAADGSFELRLDGAQVGSLAGLANGSIGGIDRAQLGIMALKPGASGSVDFDAFESRRKGWIGP